MSLKYISRILDSDWSFAIVITVLIIAMMSLPLMAEVEFGLVGDLVFNVLMAIWALFSIVIILKGFARMG